MNLDDLAKISYDRWCDGAVTQGIPWDELGYSGQKVWRSIALAVARAVLEEAADEVASCESSLQTVGTIRAILASLEEK